MNVVHHGTTLRSGVQMNVEHHGTTLRSGVQINVVHHRTTLKSSIQMNVEHHGTTLRSGVQINLEHHRTTLRISLQMNTEDHRTTLRMYTEYYRTPFGSSVRIPKRKTPGKIRESFPIGYPLDNAKYIARLLNLFGRHSVSGVVCKLPYFDLM